MLDTNVVSELRKPRPHGAVTARLRGLRDNEILIAAPTVGEIQTGIERTRTHDSVKAADIDSWLERVLQTHRILAMDERCFRTFARMMHRKSNHFIQDATIAATAQVHGLTAATRDVTDFNQFAVNVFNPFGSSPP